MMSSMDISQGNTSMSSQNEDSVSSIISKVAQQQLPLPATPCPTPAPSPAQSRKHHVQNFSNLYQKQMTIATMTPTPIVTPAATDNLVDERDKHSFYRDLYSFHEARG